jgi:hypothetical protein
MFGSVANSLQKFSASPEESSAPFRLFLLKSAKVRPQIFPAAPIFIWPFLTYAVEQSAS